MAIEPVTREERFLAAAGGRSVTTSEPITRKEQLLQGIIDAVKSGGATPDVIENAVKNYLDANPVRPGATTEQAAQIEQNKTDIADLQTEVDELKESGGNGSGQNQDYAALNNKPRINGVELSGNKTAADLGIEGATDEQVTSAVNAYLEANPVEVVEDALIYDLPQQCAVPGLQWDMLVQDDLTVTRAKAAVVMSRDRRVWVYGENLDGNNADLPHFPPYSSTGVLAIKYRACWMNGNAPSGILQDGTGVVAQLGSEYIDYNGETKTFPGGCGLPSAILAGSTGMAYFSSAERGTTTINGTRQRLIPCCATFNVGVFSDVVFETPRELTLSIDGETGAFDMSRLGYDNWYTYYTTMAPTYQGGTFHWCQPVTDGFVYLTSTDGINWEYKFTVPTPYQPRYEVAVACGIGQYKSRNLAVVRTARGYLLLMMFDPSNGKVYAQCKIPDVGSRPMVYRGKQFMLLFHTLHTTRNEMEALQVLLTDTDELVVYRWFTIYGKSTWYPMLENNPHNITGTFRDLVISGNNGGISSGRGMSTIRLKADSTKPVCVLDCVLDDPANKGYTLPVATEDTLGGVKPVAKTSAMTKSVGVDADGALYTEPDTQSASAINDMAIIYDATLEEASNSFGDAASIDVSAYHDLVLLLTVVGDSTASGNAQVTLGTNTIWARSVATTEITRTLIAQMSKTALGWVGIANTTNSTNLSDGATSSAQKQGDIELMNLTGTINTIGAKYRSASSLFGAGSRLTLMGR